MQADQSAVTHARLSTMGSGIVTTSVIIFGIITNSVMKLYMSEYTAVVYGLNICSLVVLGY